MLRFPELESLGLRIAGVSEKSEVDWGVDGRRENQIIFCTRHEIDINDISDTIQVHGIDILDVDSVGESEKIGGRSARTEADGVVTATKGCTMSIRVADCAPLFLFEPRAGVAAILHAGRRGTLLGMARAGVEKLVAGYGAAASEIRAVVGPSAGPCCYEVSQSIADCCVEAGLVTCGRFVDLWASNERQLIGAGVPREMITVSNVCTICDGRFHSYRADGGRGRNLALVVV